MVCAGGDGRGNLRVAKMDCAPKVGVAGRTLRGMALPDIYAHAGVNGNGLEEDNDAARRVATYFENRENRF